MNRYPTSLLRKQFQITSVLLLVLVLFLAMARTGVAADSPASTFEQANKLYEEGKYAEAIKGYETQIQSGHVSAALYFNLGNALFKANQVGRAIINYRLAERLAPRDPDVRANLQFARNSANGGNLESRRLWEQFATHFTVNEWTMAAMTCAWFMIGLFILILWKPTLKPSVKPALTALGLATTFLCLCLGTAWQQIYGNQSAVVTVTEAVVRYGPLDESQSFYTARDGEEMKVLDTKNDWLQVEDAKNRVGWLKRDQVTLLDARM